MPCRAKTKLRQRTHGGKLTNWQYTTDAVAHKYDFVPSAPNSREPNSSIRSGFPDYNNASLWKNDITQWLIWKPLTFRKMEIWWLITSVKERFSFSELLLSSQLFSFTVETVTNSSRTKIAIANRNTPLAIFRVENYKSQGLWYGTFDEAVLME